MANFATSDRGREILAEEGINTSDISDVLLASTVAAVATLGLMALHGGPSKKSRFGQDGSIGGRDAPNKAPLKLTQQSDEYAALINSNKPWSWENFTDGASLTVKQKREIKADAIKRGLIPDIPFKPGTKYPDFEAAGLIKRVDELPQELWKQSDFKQFKWLDARIPGGRPEGFTWHHSEISGRMELVPFGPHNSINHSGGRSKGNWADAKK